MASMFYVAITDDGTKPTERDIAKAFSSYEEANDYIDKQLDEPDALKYRMNIITILDDNYYYYVADFDYEDDLLYKRTDPRLVDGWRTYWDIKSRHLNVFSVEETAKYCLSYCYKNGLLEKVINLWSNPTEEEWEEFNKECKKAYGQRVRDIEV